MARGKTNLTPWRSQATDQVAPRFLPLEIQLLILRQMVADWKSGDHRQWASVINCLLVCSAWYAILRIEIARYVPLSDLLRVKDQTLVNEGIDRYLEEKRPLRPPYGQYREPPLIAIVAEIARQGNLTGLRKLLDAGISPPACDRSFLNPAVESGSAECVQLLLSRGSHVEFGSSEDPNELTLLALAVREGRVEIAKVLLDHGARTDVMTRPKNARQGFFSRMSLFACCASQKSYHTMELLLEHVRPPVADDSAMQIILRNGDDTMFKLLLEYFYSPESSEQWLCWSIQSLNLDLFELVLGHNPQITGRAVKTSILSNQEFITRVLLSRGVEMDSKALESLTVLSKLSEHPSHLGLILDYRPHFSQPILEYLVSTASMSNVARLCLRRGADANAVVDGKPLLTIAVANRFPLLCETLLKSGAKPNLNVPQEHMPLFRAVSDGQDELVDLLIRHGATYEACPSRIAPPIPT